MPGKTRYKNTNEAWEHLFADKNIWSRVLQDRSVELSAQVINQYYECRLMTKHDHAATRPLCFTEGQRNISILPISRSCFRIGQYEIYQKLDSFDEPPSYAPLRNNLVSLPASPEGIRSEQTAIACSYASEILHRFIHESCHDDCDNLIPTLSGRMGSNTFEFSVTNAGSYDKLQVNRAQIEIDAVYESENAIYLIEAKNHECRDFLIRQLYYPYRVLSHITGKSKPIVPIFMKYVGGCYHFYRFAFDDMYCLNSASLQSKAQYTVVNDKISFAELDELLLNVEILEEPDNVPFPQADSLERVIDLVRVLYSEEPTLTRQQVCELNLDFSPRQAKYYTDAGLYLGLIEHKGLNVELTEEGRRLAALPLHKQKLGYVKKILQHMVFHRCLEDAVRCRGQISIEKISLLIAMQHELSSNTLLRRSQTVRSWTKWILEQIDFDGEE